jgi:Rhodopirellula transposase DDE domain
MHDVKVIKQKFVVLDPLLDERARRLWAACEARVLGWGGIAAVARATGLSRTTIAAGLRESASSAATAPGGVASRTRDAGGGRKRVIERDPTLLRDLEALVDPVTRGDPQSPLRWTCKSTRRLAQELQALGHGIGARTGARVLHD